MATIQGFLQDPGALTKEWYPNFALFVNDGQNHDEPTMVGRLTPSGPEWKDAELKRLIGKTANECELAFRAG
eukprot:12418164-Karenia_brevis.AAC.1